MSHLTENAVEQDWTSLVNMLRGHTARRLDQTLYTFLQPDESEVVLSYSEMDRRARAMAVTLQQKGLAGERAVLLFPPGVDYLVAFWGCLYAGVVAVPAYPPDPMAMARTLPRLLSIIQDAQAKALLASPFIQAMAGSLLKGKAELDGVTWISSSELGDPELWEEPELHADSLAFLQYTSGSTGDPKGVMLTHGNLLYNNRMLATAYEHTEDLIGVIWVPPYHDMGLIGGILQPAFVGGQAVLLSPMDFLARPQRWVELISRYKANTTAGPNFAFDLCVRKMSEELKATLDLSSWAVAINGAEPIRKDTLDRFTQEFAGCGYRPQVMVPSYGLAEATLVAAACSPRREPVSTSVNAEALRERRVQVSQGEGAIGLVSSGRQVLDQRLAIVDPDSGEPCAADRVGEIWLSGPNIAQGYWRRPELSDWTFRARVAGDDADWLRTGDLGFIQHGELYVVGRIKDLIIINGVNYYPQDIEAAAEGAHPSVRPGCTAAFALQSQGSERLGLATELKTTPADQLPVVAEALRKAISAALGITPELIALLPKRALPKTSSGKVQRRATRDGIEDGSLSVLTRFESSHHAAPADLSEADAPSREALLAMSPEARNEALTALVSEQVRRLLPELTEAPDPNLRILELGVDSLMLVDLLGDLEDHLEITLPMEDLAAEGSIRELVKAAADELESGG